MIFEVGGEARGHTSLHKTNPLGETLDRMKVKLEFNDTAQSQGWEQSLKPALVHPLYMSHFTVTDLTIEMEMPICDGDPARKEGMIPNTYYSIDAPETVSIGIAANMLANGVEQPYSSFVIQPDPDGSLLEDVHEGDIRAGGKWLRIWLGDDLYKINDDWIKNFHNGIQRLCRLCPPLETGWEATIKPLHSPNLTSAHSMNSARNGITVTLEPVPEYEIEYAERLRIYINREGVTSGLKYSGYNYEGISQFFIWAYPSSTSTLMVDQTSTTMAKVRSGGTLVFRLNPDERDRKIVQLTSCSVTDIYNGFQEQSTSMAGGVVNWHTLANALKGQTLFDGTLILEKLESEIRFTIPEAGLKMANGKLVPEYTLHDPETVGFQLPAHCITDGLVMKWAPFTIGL